MFSFGFKVHDLIYENNSRGLYTNIFVIYIKTLFKISTVHRQARYVRCITENPDGNDT